MKALISKKNINDYDFTLEISFAYVLMLKVLHGGGNLLEMHNHYLDILSKAKLYKDGKLRVFNYKNPKVNGFTISKEVKSLIVLWKFEELAAQTWFKNKTFIEALQMLVDKNGIEMMRKAVYILIPIGNDEEYIKTIRNPQQLLYNFGKIYINRFKSEGLFKKHKDIINKKTKELKSWVD